MKLATRIERLKRQKRFTRPESPPHRPARPPRLRQAGLAALGLLIAGAATWLVLELLLWNTLPPALVGTWQVTAGPMAGSTFAFGRKGTLAVRGNNQEADFALNARVTLANKVLLTTTKNPRTGQEETRRSTVQELTATSLILALENGEVLRLVRRR